SVAPRNRMLLRQRGRSFGCDRACNNFMLGSLGRDVRYAIRTLRKSPTFTIVVVVTLSLAIGLNTAIFSVMYGVLLRALPYRSPGRLVTLAAETGEYKGAGSLTRIIRLKEASRSFDELAVFYQNTAPRTHSL